MGRNRKSLLIALAIAALLPGLAAAEPMRERAIKRFSQGEAYFKAGAYDKAIVEYQAAYDLVPKPGLLFNIGLANEKLGHAELALEFYRRYLADSPDGPRADEARARAEALRQRLDAEHEERRRAAAAERRAAEVQGRRARADRLIAARRYGAALGELGALFTLTGDPEVVFALADVHSARGDRTGAIAAYRRYLGLPGAGIHRVEAALRIEALASPSPPARPRPSLMPGLLTLAGAAALGGAGGLYQLRAIRLRDEFDEDAKTGTPPPDSRDPRLDQGERAAVVSAVLFGLAGAALATGTVLTARALLARPATRSVTLEPTAEGDRVGVSLQWVW